MSDSSSPRLTPTLTGPTSLPDGSELVLRVMPLPADVNGNGDIFGGWLMAQVDLAGAVPRKVTLEDVEWAGLVVTMGCGDECPVVPGKSYRDWPIDDPIGNAVQIVSGGFVRNIELGLGGHIDYWRDPAVCKTILGLIAPEWKRAAPATGHDPAAGSAAPSTPELVS